MKDNTSKVLGLEDVIVKTIWEDEKYRHIEIELPRRAHKCPCCGEKTDRIHDYRMQKVKDIGAFGKEVCLHLRKRRYVCEKCGKRFYEQNSFLPRYYRMTNRKVARIIEDFRSLTSASEIAKRTNGVSGDYAYLWRTYANAGHYEIQLNYEKPISDLEGYVSHYRNTSSGYGVISYTPVVVNGCDGWLMENEDGTPFRITWLDKDNGLVFQMTTNGVDSETLLTAAQGVIRK